MGVGVLYIHECKWEFMVLTSGNEITQHVVACHHAVASICIFLASSKLNEHL